MASSDSLEPIGQARHNAIALLGTHFAEDHMTLSDYEARVEAAENASTSAEIAELISDLAPLKPTALALNAQLGELNVVPASQVQAETSLVAILGQVIRKGAWEVPLNLRLKAVFGEVLLDFRGATMASGVTTLDITAVLAEVKIIVPPGVRVIMEGSTIVGGFDVQDELTAARSSSDTPTLRVRGTAVVAEVSVSSRLPGEGWWAAWKRRRAERKSRKQLKAHQQPTLGPADDNN